VTYEDKATLVSKELAAGATLPDALRVVDLRCKLTAQMRAEMRRRRADGEKVTSLATDFGITTGTVSYHCKDVVVPRPAEPALAGTVFERSAAMFGISAASLFPGRRGKPSPPVSAARWVAMLALQQLGAGTAELVLTFRRPPNEIQSRLRNLRRRRPDLVSAANRIVADLSAPPAAATTEQAA
jgi:hypothetical protein